MRFALVVAHPCSDSFNHELARRAAGGLRAGGHDVTVVDLYAEGFRPAMSHDDHVAYHSDTPIIDEQGGRYAELVSSVDGLVVVYPTWWSGLPAILKGWLERVMVPGVAFAFNDSGKVRPALTNLRHVVGISTYGSPRWYVNAVNDNGRRIITRALRLNCGWRTKTRWYGLYAMDSATDLDRREFAARIEREMAGLR